MKYYRLIDELHETENRWFLKSLNLVDENEISVWDFISTEKVEIPENKKLIMSIRNEGRPLDFTFADFEVIIVNEKVAYFLDDDECQLIPVEIEGIENTHSYFVAILLNNIDCVDESKSIFEKWQADDPIRPDLTGQYKSIYKLVINRSKISKKKIFRLENLKM